MENAKEENVSLHMDRGFNEGKVRLNAPFVVAKGNGDNGCKPSVERVQGSEDGS